MSLNTEQAQNIAFLSQKLVGLGIKCTFVRIEQGPVVSGYYFRLDPSVSMTKIMKKGEDFALALGVDKVTVQRVGGEIVLFVPNTNRQNIDFKDALHWLCTDPVPVSMELPITLGVDFHGNKQALDLTKMPHILMAGETGSGKSVFEAAILASLAIAKTPEELEIYLVDTKQLDLPLFESLPHVKTVVTELAQFHTTAGLILGIVRTRMNKMKNMGVRNITELQGMGYEMPYIVLMIDEFADLLDQDKMARKQGLYEDTPSVKEWVKQIVQISRAAGVHIICCTQRSSVKVVDGDIKTNLPCRIALRLPTEVDSRTILGTGGAQYLLGKGDMLVQRPEKDVVERFHGPYVNLGDITEVVMQQDNIRRMYKSMMLENIK